MLWQPRQEKELSETVKPCPKLDTKTIGDMEAKICGIRKLRPSKKCVQAELPEMWSLVLEEAGIQAETSRRKRGGC